MRSEPSLAFGGEVPAQPALFMMQRFVEDQRIGYRRSKSFQQASAGHHLSSAAPALSLFVDRFARNLPFMALSSPTRCRRYPLLDCTVVHEKLTRLRLGPRA